MEEPMFDGVFIKVVYCEKKNLGCVALLSKMVNTGSLLVAGKT
jgi:hypothetical protein